MENLADIKVFSFLLQGPAQFNAVQRIIDFSLLVDACHFDFKDLANAIKEYQEKYRTPPTYDILRESIIQDYEILELLAIIEEETCSEQEIGFYIDQVRQRYNAYLAKTLAKSVPDDLSQFDKEEFNSTISRMQSKIERLYKSAVFSEGDVSKSVDDRYGRYEYVEKHPDEIAGVLSGYRELDEYTWGIKNSELLVISGASSSGKSLLMMNIAMNAWLGSNQPLEHGPIINDGKNVLFFSLEMSKEQLEQRLDANIGNFPINSVTRGKLTEEEKIRYKKVLEFCRNYDKKFYICDMPRGSRVIDIEARFDSICAEFKPDLVCVDYLGIMKPNVNRNQDWLDVGYTAEDLHEFCRAKNMPVITAAQRKAKDKKAKKQHNDLEELGRSKMIGDNANIVFLIEDRDEEYLREDMIVHISKNRNGAKGKVTLLKDFEKAKIINPPDNWAGVAGDENEF